MHKVKKVLQHLPLPLYTLQFWRTGPCSFSSTSSIREYFYHNTIQFTYLFMAYLIIMSIAQIMQCWNTGMENGELEKTHKEAAMA